MSKLPPPEVLAARLDNLLTTAHFQADTGRSESAARTITEAQQLLAQLKEAMR